LKWLAFPDAPQFILFYSGRIVPIAIECDTRDELHAAAWDLIRKAVEDNLVGYYFINEMWIRRFDKSSADDEIICAKCGENHIGRATAQYRKFFPAL
jgi:hypothetical protein